MAEVKDQRVSLVATLIATNTIKPSIMYTITTMLTRRNHSTFKHRSKYSRLISLFFNFKPWSKILSRWTSTNWGFCWKSKRLSKAAMRENWKWTLQTSISRSRFIRTWCKVSCTLQRKKWKLLATIMLLKITKRS